MRFLIDIKYTKYIKYFTYKSNILNLCSIYINNKFNINLKNVEK